VVIYRLPVMMDRDWRQQCAALLAPPGDANQDSEPFNLVRPRSACPACKAPIKARHNVPVLGWLFKMESVERTKRELLIFVTPKIVKPAKVS